jgi:hypothetical protein
VKTPDGFLVLNPPDDIVDCASLGVCQPGGERLVESEEKIVYVRFDQASQTGRHLHPVYPLPHAHIEEAR